MVYVDSSKPQLVEGFIKNTFTAMIEGVREPSMEAGIIDKLPLMKVLRTCTGRQKKMGFFVLHFSRQRRQRKC